jgi:hypothetical protein
MTMVKVCTFAPGQNLDPLLQRLDGQGLAYQLREGGAGSWTSCALLCPARAPLSGRLWRAPGLSLW